MNSPNAAYIQQQQKNSTAKETFTEVISSIRIMPILKKSGFQMLTLKHQAKKTRLKLQEKCSKNTEEQYLKINMPERHTPQWSVPFFYTEKD